MITRIHYYLWNKLPFKLLHRISMQPNGCWLWQGELNRNGYGRVWHKGVRHMVHRFVWRWLNKPLSDDQVLDHICRNRNCCNPTHLSPVSNKQNVHRGKATLFKKAG